MATKATNVKVAPMDAHETFVSIRKTFAEGGSVTEKLKSLYALQAIDSELDGIYQLRGELPAEVEALESKIAELNGKVDNINATIEDCVKKIAEFKIQRQQYTDQAAKYQSQIDGGVTNSREYDSLCKEVEHNELLVQVADKRIGENEELIAQKQQDLEAVNQKIEIRKDDLKAKLEELEVISASTAKDEEKLLASRKACSEKIDARTMSAYERIRKSVKNHIAVAKIYQDACGGCHCSIAPQKIIDINGGKKLVICEYCGRILVSEDIENL